jgi:Holliday junction resolvase RusA-like endonuclease
VKSIVVAWMGVEPMPAPRPRGSSGNTYMPKDYITYRDALGFLMLDARTKAGLREPFAEPVDLVCIFWRSTRRRVDLDNLAKVAFDAGNKGVWWTDDSWIHHLDASLVLGADVPGTRIEVARLTKLKGAISD